MAQRRAIHQFAVECAAKVCCHLGTATGSEEILKRFKCQQCGLVEIKAPLPRGIGI